MHRRDFLRSAGRAAVGLGALRYADLRAAQPPRVGLIGTGWYGKVDLWRLLQVAPVEVVSLCDVDRELLADAAAQVAARQVSKKTPRTYADYRAMLAEKDLDLVLIATPDHWHALPAIEAMRAGADLYLQKPVSADVVEGQAILAAARKYERVVQVGTQRRSTPHLIHARDRIIREGRLGTVAYAEICCYFPMRPGKDLPDTTPPPHLDYEMWTGPAPMRPFNPQVHPRGWRAFMEYGNGVVGDMCIHMLDAVRWLLDLGMPTRIGSTGGIFVDKGRRSNISDTQTASFDFPGLRVVWTHRTWGDPPDPKYPWGLTLYGDKGTLKASVFSYDFTPHGQGQPIHEDVAYEFEQFPGDRTERDLERHVAPAIRGHMKDLLACMASRGRPVADIEEGCMSTTACILANVSMQVGRSITWDHATGRAVGDDEVNTLLRRPYRGPWTHPEVASV
jgi:predicted dehydrogenase